MNRQEERLIRITSITLGVDPSALTNNANLPTDLEADSLDLVELFYEVEEGFDIELDIENITTFGELLSSVLKG